jgi:hypothetical protein
MGELYEYIDKWNGNHVFTYVVVLLFILWLFSKRDIGVNMLIAIIIGWFTISYLNFKSESSINLQEKIQNIKKDNITPKLSDDAKDHKEIVDIIFSIEDLYVYNPLQHGDVIKYINYFYDLYKQSFIDNKTAYINYGLMKQYKRDALNSLMMIIFSLPEDKTVRDKINASAAVLDELMTKHLDQISYITSDYTYKNGYSIDTVVIDYGPKAANEYDDMFKNFSFEVY